MCQSFIPLMQAQFGRIVNLSSVASSLKPYSEAVQHRFRDPHASLEDLDRLAEDYLVRPSWVYCL
jgi:carbonyl reductase 1